MKRMPSDVNRLRAAMVCSSMVYFFSSRVSYVTNVPVS